MPLAPASARAWDGIGHFHPGASRGNWDLKLKGENAVPCAGGHIFKWHVYLCVCDKTMFILGWAQSRRAGGLCYSAKVLIFEQRPNNDRSI